MAATPYLNTPNGKTNYRQSAYLLTSDLKRPAETVIQCYTAKGGSFDFPAMAAIIRPQWLSEPFAKLPISGFSHS